VLGDVQGPAVAEVDRHLEAVETSARGALAEMRRMLGLLQAPAGDLPSAPAAPAPGLHNLAELVRRSAAGLGPTTLTVDDAMDLPAGLELVVYRIVQEALTNALKHAPGAAVEVSVRRQGGRLTASVLNGPGASVEHQRPDGSGRGLLGVRERVALYGGQVDAGPRAGGFALTVTIPLPGTGEELAPAGRALVTPS
jgi:signal transduction histidine kinase